MNNTKKTSDALVILHRLDRDDPEMLRLLQEARIAREIGQMIYDARIAARLTQQGLAERIGTKQSVIARLENADYEGHSLRMLRRIAEALRCELVLQFVPARTTPLQASGLRARPRRSSARAKSGPRGNRASS